MSTLGGATGGSDRKMGQLPNRLVEMMVVVGVDESSGLKAKNNPHIQMNGFNNLFHMEYQPEVLAAVSSHLAYFPFSEPQQDKHYPPSPHTAFLDRKRFKSTEPQKKLRLLPKRKKWLGKKTDKNDQVDGDGDYLDPLLNKKTDELQRRISRRISRKLSFTAVNFRDDEAAPPGSPARKNVKDLLPIPYDVLKSLATLCYPDSVRIETCQSETKVHYLVLTDMAGNRSYATCLTFYRPYLISKADKDDAEWECLLWDKEGNPDLEECQHFAYLPACCVLISKLPYYTIMKDCLSRLVQRVESNLTELNAYVKNFTLQLTMTPAPPAGHLAIQVPFDQLMLTLYPPDDPHRLVIDLPLKTVFQHFTPKFVLRLLMCVLSQQRVVFIASSYAMLTLIMESLLVMVYPFRWSLPYVPVLSEELLELLEAPGSFLMGCHSRHREQVMQVEGLVVADIDKGEVNICHTITIPKTPFEPANVFLNACRPFTHHYNPITLESTTPFSYLEMKAKLDKQQQEVNTQILHTCLQLMVNLFRDVLPGIKVEQRFFNRDQFMQITPEEFRPFYKQILHTELFSQFLKERFAQRKDAWTIQEERTRPAIKNSLGENPDQPHSLMTRRRSSVSLPSPSSALPPSLFVPQKTIALQLPPFVPDCHKIFYSKCTEEISKLMQESKSASVRASCLYLEAMLKVGCGNLVDAMESFNSLWAYDNRIFPTQVVSDVLLTMPPGDKQKLMSMEFFQRSEEWRRLSNRKLTSTVEPPIQMQVNKLPQKDLELEEFANLVQILEVASDHDTIRRLFEALTLGESQVVDPTTFTMFCECWREVTMERMEFNTLPTLQLEPSECFLKVSHMIKTNMGTGRLALTQKRLFFLAEGSHKSKEIIKLRDIRLLEKIMHTSFLTQVPALRITSKVSDDRRFVFIASLKDKLECWYMVVHEMWTGKLIAEELRDAALIQQAAQNVLLVDTVLRSGQDNLAQHHTNLAKAAAHLCYFTLRQEQGMDKLPLETKDVLQHRVDPNIREVERKAVEAILYTAGNRSSKLDEDHGPKLWCGMGNNKVLIFDASTWMLETQYIQAKDRIACLLSVDSGAQVWAGSLDTNIYVIDSRSKTCNQTLVDHAAMVTDLTYAKDKRKVFSASIAGEVIGWDTETLQKKVDFIIPGVKTLRAIKYYNEQLWCCTRESVVVVALDGVLVHTLVHPEKEHLDCFLITPNNEVWVGCGRKGQLLIWDLAALDEIKDQVPLTCNGFSKMVRVQDKVWAGTKDGLIFIVNMTTHSIEKQLQAHGDAVRSMCCAQTRYVMSGSGSKEGKIAIWRTSAICPAI